MLISTEDIKQNKNETVQPNETNNKQVMSYKLIL